MKINEMENELSLKAWSEGMLNQLITMNCALILQDDLNHVLTLKLRRATFQCLCHNCSPFRIQILKVKLWFISNCLVCIINLSLIKAGNLSVLSPHTLTFLQLMRRTNSMTRLYYYNLLVACLVNYVLSLVRWLRSISLSFSQIHNVLTFEFN